MIMNYWFNFILLTYLSFDSYRSYMLANKFIYNTLKQIIRKINQIDEHKKKLYEEFQNHLLKKGITIYGGCVRDKFMDRCPVDIDCILPISCLDELLKLIVVELFYNSTTSFNLFINQDDSSRLKMRKIINSVIKRFPNENIIDINSVVKKMISTELNIDVINVKDCKYIHEDWDIMFTLKVFYCGNIINMDVKLTCEKQKFDFLCNAMFQKMINGEIVTYVTNSKDLLINIEDCKQNCIEKKAIMLNNEIKFYNPNTYFGIHTNKRYSHCNKLHLDVDKHMFERIKKMMEKGFVIDKIDPTISVEDIVGREPCYRHCETEKIECKMCSGDFFIKRNEKIENYRKNICDTCFNVNMIRCKKCRNRYHHIRFAECSCCHMLKFKECPNCKGSFCRVQFSLCLKCHLNERIKANDNLFLMEQLPGIDLFDDSSSDISANNEINNHNYYYYSDDDFDYL